MLSREKRRVGDSSALQQDSEAVIHILNQLKEAKGLSLMSREKIATALLEDKTKSKTKKKRTANQGFDYSSLDEISPEQMAIVKDDFVQHLPDIGIKNVETVDSKSKNGHIIYRYRIVTQDDQQLPEVVFKGKKDKNNHYHATVLVDGNLLNKENQEKVVQVMVAQAKAYHEKTGKSEIVILAGGDDELAVKLMAAVLKSGLKPTLDNQEYPAQTAIEQNRIKLISERASDLAKSMSEQPHRTLKAKSTLTL